MVIERIKYPRITFEISKSFRKQLLLMAAGEGMSIGIFCRALVKEAYNRKVMIQKKRDSA